MYSCILIGFIADGGITMSYGHAHRLVAKHSFLNIT
jgi:hypothetical protein